MGQEIISFLATHSQGVITSGVVRDSSSLVGKPLNEKLNFTSNLEEGISACDCVIDFSTPINSVQVVSVADSRNKPILIGTTGLEGALLERVKGHSGKIPICVAPNTSLGIFVLKKLARQTAELLGADFDIHVSETHHSQKKDAPSGTAKLLESSLLEVKKGVTTSSIRGGDIIGEHTVHFFGQGEKLELTHKATNRSLFARGAVFIAQKLAEMPPGFYGIDDVLR